LHAVDEDPLPAVADRAAVRDDRSPAVRGGRADPRDHRRARERHARARQGDQPRAGEQRRPCAVRARRRRRSVRRRGQRRVPRARAPRAGVAQLGARRGGDVTALATRLRRLVLVIGLPALLFGLWWLLSDDSKNFYLPPLRKIVAAFGPTWSSRLTSDVLPSIARLLVGYAGAVVIGVGLGVPLGARPRLRALFEPALELFRAIPPPALVPVFML